MRKKKCPKPRHVRGLASNIRRLGQYELVDKEVIEKIIDALELVPDDTVLEIGAGTGVLTIPIKEKVKKIIAVEVDKRFCVFLEAKGIEPVNIDFLKMDLGSLPPFVKIVSNLPYYITTPIITKILEEKVPFSIMVLTMQKEVASRLTALPGSKVYGAISVLVQFHTIPEIVASVSRKYFKPVPDVDSCVVKFVRREKRELPFPEDFLFKVVRQSFSSRRKMLKNTLGNPEGLEIDLSRRAETLGVEEFCRLAEGLWKRHKA